MTAEPNDRKPEIEAFAKAFAPDRTRRVPGPISRLNGLVLVAGAVPILVVSWFAYRRALPTTGFLSMRASPGLTVEQLRTRNQEGAPWMALTSIPLLVAGVWLLLRRPDNAMARAVMIVAGVVFAVAGLVASSMAGGCIGIGPGSC